MKSTHKGVSAMLIESEDGAIRIESSGKRLRFIQSGKLPNHEGIALFTTLEPGTARSLNNAIERWLASVGQKTPEEGAAGE